MDQRIQSLIRFARTASPFYAQIYAGLPDNASFEDVPIIDHAEFWAASKKDPTSTMTGPHIDGVLMKTGGTTNRPKTTAYSQIELQRITTLLADGLLAAGVLPGERIANMFYAGDLYGSFLLHVLSIMELPIPAVHVPIGGLTAISDAVSLIVQCKVTALLTTATWLVKLSAYIIDNSIVLTDVRCIMFAGEPLFPEQEKIIRDAFPQASVKSCIYGTIDAGVLAASTPGCDTREHRAFAGSIVLEIVKNDGSGEVIHEPGVPGILVATNMIRWLAPVIRYPTGDLAAWVDKPSGTFKLLGRAAQAVRLGPVSIDVADLRSVVSSSLPDIDLHGVQAVLTRKGGVDCMELVIAAKPENSDEAARTITAELHRQRPMFQQHVDLGLVAELVVKFVDHQDLIVAPGSHKLMDVVEKRFQVNGS